MAPIYTKHDGDFDFHGVGANRRRLCQIVQVRNLHGHISQLLKGFRLNASIEVRARFCGRWSLEHPHTGQAAFHLVTGGRCWLHRDGQPPLHLASGDLLILPRDLQHTLSDSPDPARLAPPPEFLPLSASRRDGTAVVCGRLSFEAGVAHPVLGMLPEVFLVPTARAIRGVAMRRIVSVLVAESRDAMPGAEAVIDRLCDALFIEALRWHLNEQGDRNGLVAALADPVVCRALQLIHQRPAELWTLNNLARTVAMSRSALASRFRTVLGQSPMNYLYRWRMQLAYDRLKQGQPVAAVAERCGYRTEAAFRKAFKRHYGIGPGAVRGRIPSLRSDA